MAVSIETLLSDGCKGTYCVECPLYQYDEDNELADKICAYVHDVVTRRTREISRR